MGGAIKQEFQSSLFTKAAALVALPALRGFKKQIRPAPLRTVPFFGLRGVVIKKPRRYRCHRSYVHALEETYYEAKADSLTKIEQGVAAQLSVLTERRLEAEQAAMANNISKIVSLIKYFPRPQGLSDGLGMMFSRLKHSIADYLDLLLKLRVSCIAVMGMIGYNQPFTKLTKRLCHETR